MAIDTYWSNVVIALHMDGENNSTAFVDEKNNVVTAVGNACINTATKKFGTGSAYFDGAGDFLTIPATTQFSIGTGDFTVECWFYPIGSSFQGFLFGTGIDNAGTPGWFWVEVRNDQVMFNGYSVTSVQALTTISGGAWHHIAITRSTGVLSIYLNGTWIGGNSQHLSSLGVGTHYSIGAGNSSNSFGTPFSGYIDDFRVTKGVARYTANFTPPTETFTTDAAGVVTGSVTDSASSSAVRLVRAYRRDTGEFVGEALSNESGAFSISTSSLTNHFVVCHDASSSPPAGGSLNALIFDDVTPIQV